MQTLTIHPHDIQIGDYVVGFPTPVAHTAIDGWRIKITFADGQVWDVINHFRTTVQRQEPPPHPTREGT